MSTNTEHWGGLKKQIQFNGDGSINWDFHPYSKSWSIQRLGFKGINQLLESFFTLKTPCYLASSNTPSETICPSTQQALKEVATFFTQEELYWLIDLQGRWLIEFNREGIFTLEIFVQKNPTLVSYYRDTPHPSELGLEP